MVRATGVLRLATGRIASRLDDLLALPFRGMVWLYRRFISPLLPPACRFEPSCSAYAAEALARCGGLRGISLTAWRLARCNPWGGHGLDPVPPCRCGSRPPPVTGPRPSSLSRDPP